MSKNKTITWPALSFMAFSTLWSFNNVVNGFVYFNGIQVIFSWLIMFAVFFLPYAFMVGELGSTFKTQGGGVTSWVKGTSGAKIAYYAGWTYWAVHITYTAFKGTNGLKALSWMVFGNAETYDSLPVIGVQLVTLAVFLFFCFIASRGLGMLKKLATLAGSSMFVMSLLYILLMFTAPTLNPGGTYLAVDASIENLIPNFDIPYFTNLSILVFALGGIEKISPYINKMKGDPAHQFPKSIIFAAFMVIVCALLGTVAMSMMFDPVDVHAHLNSYISNGPYWAFEKLGAYYGVGNLFMMVFAACNAIGQFSTLVVSIDAPLRMLLDDENTRQFVPYGLLKQNRNGAYINGIKLVVVLCSCIIGVQMFVPGAADILAQLNKLNSVCMPLRYLWIFFAYIMLKRSETIRCDGFVFIKGKRLGMCAGAWCLFLVTACSISGMYSTDPFTLALNVATPFLLLALGLIMPKIRSAQDRRRLDTESRPA